MTVSDLISLLILLYFWYYHFMYVHICMYIRINVMFIPVQQLLNESFMMRSTVGVISQVVKRVLILNLIYLLSNYQLLQKRKRSMDYIPWQYEDFRKWKVFWSYIKYRVLLVQNPYINFSDPFTGYSFIVLKALWIRALQFQ